MINTLIESIAYVLMVQNHVESIIYILLVQNHIESIVYVLHETNLRLGPSLSENCSLGDLESSPSLNPKF